MTNELTILEETNENKDKYHPLQYWISPSLMNKEYKISLLINQIQPRLRRTKVFGDSKTLHIGTLDEVFEKINSNLYFISYQVLKDAVETFKLTHFQISDPSRQCLSLCLNGLCCAASGSYEKDEFINIVKKVTLLGGKFVSANNSSDIDVFITNFPILPPSISYFTKDLKIVTSDWINECFNQFERLSLENYSLKSFESLSISSSDLEPYQNRQLKNTILKGGGIWKESLDSSVTLLVASHFSSTPKVKLALQMSVPIINPKWINMQSKNFCSIHQYVMNFWVLNNFKPSTLFSNKNFAIHVDCEDRSCVIDAVKAHSGSFSPSPDYLIVPHFFQASNAARCVTSSWIWSCITEKKIIDPDSSILYRPFPYQKASSKLKGYVIVLYHIEDEAARYEISECIRALGAIVHYKISSMSNVVVSVKENDNLFNAAKKYKIQVLSFPWIIKLINTGKIPPIDNYVLQSKKDIAVKTIIRGIKKKDEAMELSKDQFIFSQDINNKNSNSIINQETNLSYFSDDEIEENTAPIIDVSYETTVSKVKKRKYDDDDPLLEILSKCKL